MAAYADVVSLPDLLHQHAVACVDGRKPECVVGAPGGNAGLFVLMLGAYESFTNERLTGKEVSQLFGRYLEEFGHFYMHTDDLASEALLGELSRHEGTRDVARSLVASDDEAGWLAAPPAEGRSLLLEHLVRPEHVGCGHLKMMLLHPDEYDVRAELVRAVITDFYRRLWAGDRRLVLDVLEGAHREKAVLRVHVDRPNEADTDIALACPRHADADVFVYHPEAVAFLVDESAEFLLRSGRIQPDEVDPFTNVQSAMAAAQLSATLRHLAPDLPVFDATFTVGGERMTCVEIRSAT